MFATLCILLAARSIRPGITVTAESTSSDCKADFCPIQPVQTVASLKRRVQALQVVRFRAEAGDARSMAFAPNRDVVATGHWDGSVKLWNVSTGQLQRAALKAHGGVVLCLAFSADGNSLVSGSADNSGKLWDALTLQERAVVRGSGWVVSIAYSTDTNSFLTGFNDGTAVQWDAGTGMSIRSFPGNHRGAQQQRGAALLSVALGAAAALTSSGDDKTLLWPHHASDEADPRVLQGHQGWVVAAAFSPDGSAVLTGSHDNTARLWDVATGRQLHELSGSDHDVLAVGFSDDGALAIAGARDGSSMLWDASTGELLRKLPANPKTTIASVSLTSRLFVGILETPPPKPNDDLAKCEAQCAAQQSR